MVISGNLELIHEAFDGSAKLSSARRAQLRQLLDSAEAATEHAAKITQRLSHGPDLSTGAGQVRPIVR